MIRFSSGLNHSYQPYLNEVSIDSKYGLNFWLREGKEYFSSQDQGQNDFIISSFDLKNFLTPYAFDINRLSCAAIESLNDISLGITAPKFLGWLIIKYYYSAFFSVHSILKITGNSLSNIDPYSISKIRELTRTRGYNISGNLNSGQYCIDINHNLNTFRFYKEAKYDDSHKGLWLKFLDFLNHNKLQVYNNLIQSEAQIVVDKIEELISALTNHGKNNGAWLSEIRNKVNYSQNYGIWYPYTDFDKNLNDIKNLKSLCKKSPLDIDLQTYRGKDLLYFVRTCQLINSINFELQIDLLQKHPNNKSFLLHGIFAYEKKYVKKEGLNSGFLAI